MRRASGYSLAVVTIVLAAHTAARADLHASAEAGDLEALAAAIDAGVDIDAVRVDGTTALHWAVYADQTAAAQRLLEAGASATAQDRYGTTPLYLAAVNGNAALVAALVEHGADARAWAPHGESLLMTAVRTGVPAAVEVILAHGADVDARDPAFGQTALMMAVRERHEEVVATLIEHGADVDARTAVGPAPAFRPPCKGTGCGSEGVGINRGGLPDRGRRDAASGGMTPLLYAARDGALDEARLLVDAGADVSLAEANDISPLLMAVLNNQLAIARQLLAAGAEPNADDFWGRTPLFAAVEYRNLDMNNRDQDSPTDNGVERVPLLELAAELLERGADPNARTREVPPSRRWLYSLGDVSWVDFTGQTPFLRAALSGDTASMRLLLEHGADPNLPTFAGTTPAMAAAGVNWVVAQTYTEGEDALQAAIELCLAHGADINAVNSMGLTAVLGAANRGSNQLLRYLAARGAHLDVADVQGRTALRWAEGVFLAAVGAERKPETIALLEGLMAAQENERD